MNNKARIITKHDTTANWNAAVDFIPMKGEVIIYDDYQTEPGWENIYNEFDNPLELGAIASATGQDTPSRTRVRTHGYIGVEPNTEYTISSNIYQVFILEYVHGNYLNIFDGWKTLPYTFTTASGCHQIRLVFAKADNSDILPSEVEWVRVAYRIDVPTPNIKVGDGVRVAADLPFIYSEVDPTVANWAKQPNKPEYDASEISYDADNPHSVLVNADDVEAAVSELDTYIAEHPAPSKTSDLTNDSGYITASDIPVSSVNGKTGAVVLDASDVDALPSDTEIPSKTSDLVNDSGFIDGIDSTDVTSALGYTPYPDTNPNGYITISQVPTPPVTSVNGRTGAVTGLAEASSLAAVATSGDYDDLIDKPTIPSKTSDLTNNSGFVTHDNQVEQSYISNPSSYSYWRGLAIGASAVASESGSFATTTDKVYIADSIRVQPSTGTVKAATFKGNLTGNVTGTASGNLVASDLEEMTDVEIDAIIV